MLLTILVLVFFGIVLVMLEMFVPGGLVGTLGVFCILVALALSLMAPELDHWPHWGRFGLASGILVCSLGAILLWMRYFAVRLFHKTFTLEKTLPSQAPAGQEWIGHQGVSLTELRPLGRAEIHGQRFEVRSRDGFLPSGARIEVVGTEPGNLVVRAL